MLAEAIHPNPWMILPFVALLATIALAPLLFAGWWTRHYPKVAYALGAVTLGYYLFGLQAYARVLHTGIEYVSFICLIGSLFVVSGGIHITVKGEATPVDNVLFLLFGALISNVLGTTGASMLLIRPWLRMNKYRVTAHHVVFFIFIVSNVGGCLTPIGDPPLFLGYLKGVPFWWVAEHCWPMWATGLGILLVMFYMVDRRNYLRAPKAVREQLAEPADTWRFEGGVNVFFLAVILGAVFINHPPFLREGLMVAAAAGSWFATRKHIHEANHFNFHPIQEVAILFVGIFATMMPALDWLGANAKSFGAPTASLFYWGSGTLSSMLDNAPTYLSFLSAAAGPALEDKAAFARLMAEPGFNSLLVAISVAAVFFGANTYIGNGPNFMVKAIADQQKVHTPTFLGYVFRFTLPFMLPMLIVVWLLFFRG
ncbi:MAG: sodium:proton antiporter [Verrucomicrobia bacterium]|nr:sodium:proton antiporter [Verrucomicrobiota bacterium]